MYTIEKSAQKSRPNLGNICKSLGIEVKYATKKVLKNDIGRVCFIKGQYMILLDESAPRDVLQMVLCHEVAHILLGHLLPSYVGSLEQKEFEAESLGYIIYSYVYNRFYMAEDISVTNSSKIYISHSFYPKKSNNNKEVL